MSHPQSLGLQRLAGRSALVSGAARGIGLATARRLAAEGATVLLTDIRDDEGQAAAATIPGAAYAHLDVRREEDWATVVPSWVAQTGRLDVLVNNAGVTGFEDGVVAHDPATVSLAAWRAVMAVNAEGTLLGCQAALAAMRPAGRGSIVNIGSLASVTALGRGHIAYSMAMGAVAQMTRELSTEWMGRGVRVNAILPAQVMNKGLEARIAGDPQLGQQFLRGIPAGRLGAPDDIRGLAVLLASDASSWISGALIPMDGGNLAKNAGGSHPGMPW